MPGAGKTVPSRSGGCRPLEGRRHPSDAVGKLLRGDLLPRSVHQKREGQGRGPLDGHHREWPEDIVMTPEIKALVDEKWLSYGI